jgi:hypothetical protein
MILRRGSSEEKIQPCRWTPSHTCPPVTVDSPYPSLRCDFGSVNIISFESPSTHSAVSSAARLKLLTARVRVTTVFLYNKPLTHLPGA